MIHKPRQILPTKEDNANKFEMLHNCLQETTQYEMNRMNMAREREL